MKTWEFFLTHGPKSGAASIDPNPNLFFGPFIGGQDKKSGLLISFITRGFKRTKYYTLDYDLLKKVSFMISNIQILDSIVLESNEKNCSELAEKQDIYSWTQSDPLSLYREYFRHYSFFSFKQF